MSKTAHEIWEETATQALLRLLHQAIKDQATCCILLKLELNQGNVRGVRSSYETEERRPQ